MTLLASSSPRDVDADFLALPLDAIADAVVATARAAGAEWADVRVQRTLTGGLNTRDAKLENNHRDAELGLGVRVILDGTWGFASDPVVSPAGARRATERALELARITRPLSIERVQLAPQKSMGTANWTSPYEIDPFDVSDADKTKLICDMSSALMVAGVSHVDGYTLYTKDQKFYADMSGNRLASQRVNIQAGFTATHIDTATGEYTTLNTTAQPTGRGWEWLTGDAFDWNKEIAELPGILALKAAAPVVKPGRYDLVIDPTNLWLTIHESIGHATELDRVLGYEANYAGTSFIKPSDVGNLVYGSSLLNVTGDRDTPHGLSTVGFDDEGVPGQRFDIIRDGVLVGLQTDRSTASVAGLAASNGCAYADGPSHVPLQRMPNISMAPAENGPDIAGLIAGVEDGLYIKGDDSWSIDMQRKNFQFTGQQFWRIRNGQLDGMVKDAAYQSTTPELWGSLSAVGGPSTYVLHGADNCGKGQPGQSAPVSHGAPAARFDNIRILDTNEEN